MITATIGHLTNTYVWVKTSAPAVCDGFGTFAIHAIGHQRWVLIEQEHFTWQTQRYSSGLHGYTVCDGTHLQGATVERFGEQLSGRKGDA
jgi:hypothetical protein